jgi:hypothetical protein
VDEVRPYESLYPSIALDRDGRPHVAYVREWDTPPGRRGYLLMYAHLQDGAWEIETVDSGGNYPSLALDAAGRPHISYRSGQGDLNYAHLALVGGLYQIYLPLVQEFGE